MVGRQIRSMVSLASLSQTPWFSCRERGTRASRDFLLIAKPVDLSQVIPYDRAGLAEAVMSLFFEVLAWLTIGLGIWAIAERLLSLAPARGPSHGAHARPGMTQPASRRDGWRGLRYALLTIAGGAYVLAGEGKHDAGRWLLGIITFLVVAPDVIAWLRSHIGRKPGGTTAEPS